MRAVRAYVGLGANLGDARAQLAGALESLARLPQTTVAAVSPWFRTAPVDADGPDYLNAVAALTTALHADALLAALHAIEQAFDRQRPYRNAPRTLDLDLLLYGDAVIATPTLTVPHPRLTERAFVLRPLLALAPDLVLPGGHRLDAFWPAVADQRIDEVCPPNVAQTTPAGRAPGRPKPARIPSGDRSVYPPDEGST